MAKKEKQKEKEKIKVETKPAKEKFPFVIDLLMMLLIIVNLIFIIFDWNFSFHFFQEILKRHFPDFYIFYATHIHPDFFLYDLYFVSIFVSEVLIRWAFAIKNRTYGVWFFYPIVHWYDVLGCIPQGVFRWLRLFRVFSISMRLHRLGIIDLRKTYPLRKIDEIYQIFLEEITDRVLVNLLDAIKREIIKENTTNESVIVEVVKPHRESLAKWITERIQQVTEANYNAFRRDLKQQIEHTVREGFASSKGMKRVENFPLVGKQIFSSLEETISEITFELLESGAKNVSSEKNTALIEDAIRSVFDSMLTQEKTSEINEIVKDICVQTIEKIKDDIQTKSWLLQKKEEEALGDLNDLLHEKKKVS